MFDKITKPLELKNQKVDLRVAKTHSNIRRALLELLDKMSYADIRVEDIISHSLINRATFYKYYTGKDDLVGKMIDAVKDRLYNYVQQREKYSNLNDFLFDQIPKLYEMRFEILMLWKINTPRHNLRQDMVNMVSMRFKELSIKAFPTKSAEDLDIQAHLFSHMAVNFIEYVFTKDTMDNIYRASDHLEQILKMMNFDYASISVKQTN
ncbi:hypothetical protein CKF54_05145 [Psittacicella hinzii]|uniref:HTH tetR-type domain-containing protein n=1 Tax=Psittacicella hinzii TaxID=2028575 RepID=A0A3A1Y4V4_9GAMM|nr:TetR/AcrR family transcriptional regulator [Psittacicella hinzii]RIY32296.1 hypothetical protein CKF54_05145 [Psittacicella hinzii]